MVECRYENARKFDDFCCLIVNRGTHISFFQSLLSLSGCKKNHWKSTQFISTVFVGGLRRIFRGERAVGSWDRVDHRRSRPRLVRLNGSGVVVDRSYTYSVAAVVSAFLWPLLLYIVATLGCILVLCVFCVSAQSETASSRNTTSTVDSRSTTTLVGENADLSVIPGNELHQLPPDDVNSVDRHSGCRFFKAMGFV